MSYRVFDSDDNNHKKSKLAQFSAQYKYYDKEIA